MIYISSSCIKTEKIHNSVKFIAEQGFKNIELSGGTQYYHGFEDDLIELKKEYNLNFLCHNYFPPPKKPFVLNLASLDDSAHYASMENIEKSLILSNKLDSKKFALHAGFYIDIKITEIGRKIDKRLLFDESESKQRFYESINRVNDISAGVEIYIENNVYSEENSRNYGEDNPFMLTNYDAYLEMRESIDFKLLLDVGHLKVSCNTLGLNFSDEFHKMIEVSDHIHISDNDGLADTNSPLKNDSDMVKLLSYSRLKDKDFTIEVYSGISDVKTTHNILDNLINAN
jgi:sugar phosphate isomerase/epimerase